MKPRFFMLQEKGRILVRILLNRYHAQNAQEFLKRLPKEEAQLIAGQDKTKTDIDAVFVKPREFLKEVHYSWISPYVEKLPLHIQELLISALPSSLSIGLKKHLKIQSSRVEMSERASNFFTQKLYDQVRQPDILPLSFLPKEELFVLMGLTRIQLIELIGFLGLYDLTEELRPIVDKKVLQMVYRCLDSKEMQFVRNCQLQKSKIAAVKLDLQKWDGDCESLKHQLHLRGLYRLGRALSGSHPHFLWYLLRRLDTGRSAIIEKYSRMKSTSTALLNLEQQVMNVLNFLKQKSEL